MRADARAISAARQRHWRERRRKGVRVVRLEVDEVAVVEALISLGLLRQCDADDWGRVEAALARGLQVVLIEP